MGIATTPFRDFNAPEGDALERAFRCNGNAQCLSYAAATPMCPSFKATADLRHSPKGRADALRAWHKARQEEGPDLPRREADLRAVLDTCLGCKACASTCPVQVDIPTMRAAFLADYFARHARPMADRLILAAERFSPLALRLAPVLAPLWPLATRLAECLTGSRDLPRQIARLPRDLWLDEADLADALPEGSVILVQDWFTALFDGRVQHQVIAGLRVLGYRPRLLRMRPAGKAAQGAGDRAGFEAMARILVRRLDRAAATGAPLVAFEPAFAMMLRQDYPRAGFAPPPVLLPQEFLSDELSAEARRRRFPQARAGQRARLLSHCTEATGLPEAGALWARVFQALGIQVQTPATGCCGMAGLFGHQNRHQAMSRKLFDLSWREHLESGETVLATGFSCRCQAERLSGRVPGHPLGLIAKALR